MKYSTVLNNSYSFNVQNRLIVLVSKVNMNDERKRYEVIVHEYDPKRIDKENIALDD